VTAVVYFDASALVKLVRSERESAALRAFLSAHLARATSIVGVIETRRAAARHHDADLRQLDFVLGSFEVIDLDGRVALLATRATPASLRTLDAIHLASAMAFESDLQALVTYDRRLTDAARGLGVPTASPT
jgi:predicted nucleic acid-binding protein